MRINDSKAKQAEDKDGQQEEKQNDLVNVSYTDIKNEMGDILKQAKEINSLISGRDKKINKATESKIEMALQFIYSQLEVMLDKNIYLQFIQRNGTHDLAVNFVGHGWVKSIGASLHQVKSVFAKYQELHAYFAERNLTTTYLIHTPKEGLLDFAKKTRELAIVSKQLVASIISLEKDPFVKSLLSVAGIKGVIYQNAQIEVIGEEGEVLQDEQPWDVIEEEAQAITKIFNTLAHYYEKAATRHFQTHFQISKTIQTLALIQRMQLEYDSFKSLPHNRIEVSTAQ